MPYGKIKLKNGVCQFGSSTDMRRTMPKITSNIPSSNSTGSPTSKEDLLELAKAMAKEMAAEIIENMPQQQVIVSSDQALHKSQEDSIIEIEESFIDPSESGGYKANLDNIESKTGNSIKDKLAKLKKIQGDK